MANQTNEQNPIQINTADETSKGRYSNTMLVDRKSLSSTGCSIRRTGHILCHGSS
jgi:hypothetical protein